MAQKDRLQWKSFKGSNKEFLRDLYFDNYQNLYDYGCRLINDPELVKDSIQDLFVKLWGRRKSLENVEKIKPYLIVSLRSIVYNHLRRSNRIDLFECWNDIPFEFNLMENNEPEFYDQEEDRRRLTKALSSITHRQKEAIYLRYYEGLSTDEIAEVMDMTPKAVYKLISRGIYALRKLLTILVTTLTLFL